MSEIEQSSVTTVMSQPKIMTIEEFATGCYMSEVNRRVLNPVGLEMVWAPVGENYVFAILDQRDNAAGYVPKFNENEVIKRVDDATTYDKLRESKRNLRVQVFGNELQHPTRAVSKNTGSTLAELLPNIGDGYTAINKNNTIVVFADPTIRAICVKYVATAQTSELALTDIDVLYSTGWYLMSVHEVNQVKEKWAALNAVQPEATAESSVQEVSEAPAE